MQKFVRGVPYILERGAKGFSHWVPAIKITTWSPDTCDCTINYWWDRRRPMEGQEHLFCSQADAVALRPDVLYRKGGEVNHRSVKGWKWQEAKCQAHRKLDGDSWFEAVLAENRLKNRIPGIVVEAIPPLQFVQVVKEYSYERLSGLVAWLLPKVSEVVAMPLLVKALPEIERDPQAARRFASETVHFFYRWSFTRSRMLLADFPDLGLSAAQLEDIGRACAQEFGEEKVSLGPVPVASKRKTKVASI